MNRKITGKTLAIFLIIYSGTTVHAQLTNMAYVSQNIYSANRNGKEIGWMKTISSQVGNELFLTTESNLVIQMLFSFEAKAITANKFIGNTLYQAGVHRTLNGKIKLENALQFINGQYKIIKGKSEQSFSKPIINTVTSIYFKEPVNITQLFSEVYLCYVELKKTAPSVYTSLLPDGGSMTYSYTVGKLTHITAKTAYGTVQFQLKQ